MGDIVPAADNSTEMIAVGVLGSIVVAGGRVRSTSIMRCCWRGSNQIRRRSSAGRRGNGAHVDGDGDIGSSQRLKYTSLKRRGAGSGYFPWPRLRLSDPYSSP